MVQWARGGYSVSKIEEAKRNKSKKKRNRLIFRTSILVVLLAALVFALVSNFIKDQPEVKAGVEAPPFQLKQLNGDEAGTYRTFDEFKGKGIMLNFWATYCKPCEEEMPYMQSLYDEYQDKGIEIIAVSMDVTELVVTDFVERHKLTFPVLHDIKQEVTELYGIVPLPTSLFINPEGEVVEIVEGPLTLSKLEGYLKQIQPDEL